MAVDTTVTDALKTKATGPSNVTADGTSVTDRGLAEIEQADRYLKSQSAAKRAGFGIRAQKIIPPGAG